MVDYHFGSSPRVRGKPTMSVLTRLTSRIIPARAGQTPVWKAREHGITDHPRACGANGGARHDAIGQHGSSPRVRGKLRGQQGRVGASRIIPARAGQTPTRPPSPSLCPDHPRACGANLSHQIDVGRLAGSSPRVRGKPGETQGHR